VIALKRLDALRGVRLHALKNYDSITWSLNVSIKNPKEMTDLVFGDLILDKSLDGLLETHLVLTNTDCPQTLSDLTRSYDRIF
jgi:hypothetical protein